MNCSLYKKVLYISDKKQFTKTFCNLQRETNSATTTPTPVDKPTEQNTHHEYGAQRKHQHIGGLTHAEDDATTAAQKSTCEPERYAKVAAQEL